MTNNQSHRALVLKVAQAISDRQYPTQMDFKDAEAAIAAVYEALREPSEEMITAAWMRYMRVCTGVHVTRGNVASVVTAALSASPIVQEGE